MATIRSLRQSITTMERNQALKLVLSIREKRKHRKRSPSQKTSARKLVQTTLRTLTPETARQFLAQLKDQTK